MAAVLMQCACVHRFQWGQQMRSDRPPSFCLSRLWNSFETCVYHKHPKESNVSRETSTYKGPIQTSCKWRKSALNVCFCTSRAGLLFWQTCDQLNQCESEEWMSSFSLKCSIRVFGKLSSSGRAGVLLSLIDRAIILGVFSWHLYDLTKTKSLWYQRYGGSLNLPAASPRT